MSRRLIALLTIALVLGPAATAHAAWFPSAAVDGPNDSVLSVAGIDVARDGNGAIAYLRSDGGLPHAFIARLVNGAWRAPERADPTTGAVSELKVTAGDGNRLAVAWIADGSVYAAVAAGGTAPGPLGPVVQLGGPDASGLDLDMGVNGAAYAIWSQGGDVRAARLQDSTWTGLASPVDYDAGNSAGTGTSRPRVAVSAEGYAVAVWGELLSDARTHVFSRRLTGTTLSAFPQDLTSSDGAADSPDIDIENDGSFAWTVYRQFVGGVPHTFGRRLIGSQYDPPEQIDGNVPSGEPRVDLSGDGSGGAVAQGLDGTVTGAVLDHDHFQPATALGTTVLTPPAPDVATSDREDVAAAWQSAAPDGTVLAHARFRAAGEGWGADTLISNSGLGTVDDPGVFISGDRVGDMAVAMVQGPPGARALTAGVFDRPPGAPFIDSTQAYKRKTRPELRWRAGVELWGSPVFRVLMDGVQIGQTTNTTLVPATPLTTGKHVWQVEAVDRAGQVARSRARTLKIDATAPTLTVKVSGKRAAGKTLKISVKAVDHGGSGLDHVTVDFDDHSATTHAKTVTHRYRRGKYTLDVAAVDKAGNIAHKLTTLKIKKK